MGRTRPVREPVVLGVLRMEWIKEAVLVEIGDMDVESLLLLVEYIRGRG